MMGYKAVELLDYESVVIRFICSGCKYRLITKKILIPDDLAEPEEGDILLNNVTEKICPKCSRWHIIHVGFDEAGLGNCGYVEIERVDRKDILDITPYDHEIYCNLDDFNLDEDNYSHLYYDEPFVRFQQEINSLRELNKQNFKNKIHQDTIRRLIYYGGIICLEDYLFSLLEREVLHDERFFKNFVKTYKNINRRKIELGNIYNELDDFHSIVKKELSDVIYHDLPKVRGRYMDTLWISFPSIENLMKFILKRHDIIHRNGKTKTT